MSKASSGPVMNFRQRNTLIYLAFLLVPLILYVGAFVYPVLDTVRLSLFAWDGFSQPRFVGLDNFFSLAADPRFQNSLFNNVKWFIFFLTIPTVVGLGLALLLDSEIKGSNIFRTIFFIPFTITTVAVASAWRWMYLPGSGVMTALMEAVGLGQFAPNWLGDPNIATYSIMLATLWSWSGFTFLIYFAGLRGLPVELIEAAKIDGASYLTILFQIKLPLLWPSTTVILGIAAIDSMKVFDIIWSMTQGGPYRSTSVLAVEMYETSFVRFQMGQGAAVSIVLLVVAALVVIPHIYQMSKRVDEVRE